MTIRTYSELITINTFEDRFKYLQLNGSVGSETFGFDRYLNQAFYRSQEWKRIRDEIIVRDYGCDLGIKGREIFGKIYIHHMNPVTPKDIVDATRFLLDPEYLICMTHSTHNAVHYGDESLLQKGPVARKKNDTCPWKQIGGN